MMIDHSSREGVLHHDERELLQNIFEFGDTVVEEVMTNRTNIVAFPLNENVNEALPKMIESGFSQYPVYDESIDDIRGIIFLKDIFKYQVQNKLKEEIFERFLRPTIFVPENKKIDSLLHMMQAQRTKVAIVADEFGGTEGMVTISDILEEIVGNIEDEYTTVEEFIKKIDGIY